MSTCKKTFIVLREGKVIVPLVSAPRSGQGAVGGASRNSLVLEKNVAYLDCGLFRAKYPPALANVPVSNPRERERERERERGHKSDWYLVR